MNAIDLHAHVLVPEVDALVERHPLGAEELRRQAFEMGRPSLEQNIALLPGYRPKLTDVATRLADMDAAGVAKQVLSISPTQYYYFAERELAARIVDTANARLGELARSRPDRFSALGTVALQHPELAVEQLTDAVRVHRLSGVMISSRAGATELADPALAPFFARAVELSAVVFVHPLGCTMGDRLDSHYLSNVIGQPLETTIALSKLIFAGTFDRHPELRLCAAHGGGYLPFYVGRSDHAWHVRPECRTTRHEPSAYLRQLYYDSVVYSPLALRHLIDQVGTSRIVVGTDYPFDMGMTRPLVLLRDTPGLSDQERADIAAGNALRLLEGGDPR